MPDQTLLQMQQIITMGKPEACKQKVTLIHKTAVLFYK